MSERSLRRRRQTPRSLTLAGFLPYRLSVAAHAVSTLIGDSLQQQFRLPLPQWRVLAIVHEYGALAQGQLMALSTMDKQRVSRAARALQRRGLLRRAPQRRDRRAYVLRLTSRGQRVFAGLAPVAQRLERRLLSGLPQRQVRALRAQLLELQRRALSLAASDRPTKGGFG